MAMRNIQVRRGVKTLAMVAVGTILAIIIFKMLIPVLITFAILAFIGWLIMRVWRKA